MFVPKYACSRSNPWLGWAPLTHEQYVASHDIKEPLRQMEMLTSLLRRSSFERNSASVSASPCASPGVHSMPFS